jgi:hypothetical protein
MLPAQWHVQDEMYASLIQYLARSPLCAYRYNFKSDPRAVGAVVLLSANESSYTGESFDLFFYRKPSLTIGSDPGPRKFNQGTPHPTGMLAGSLHAFAIVMSEF